MFKYKPIVDRVLNGGTQRVFRFENSYGASVVNHEFSYGSEQGYYELAVLYFHNKDSNESELTYSTPITNDVIGWLSVEKVNELLDRIKELEV